MAAIISVFWACAWYILRRMNRVLSLAIVLQLRRSAVIENSGSAEQLLLGEGFLGL